MHTRLNLKRWLAFIFLLILVAGSGPCPNCYDDECSDPSAAWCEGQVASVCSMPNDNGAYALSREDCAFDGLVCVMGVESSHGEAGRRVAGCLDIQPCETLGAYECGEATEDALAPLLRCVAVDDAWLQAHELMSIEEPAGLERVLTSTGLPCLPCASSCICPQGSRCEEGFCLVGELEDALICCEGDRGSRCEEGEACQTLTGDEGVCGEG